MAYRIIAAALLLCTSAAQAQSTVLDFQSGLYTPRFYVGSFEYHEDGFVVISDPTPFDVGPLDSVRNAWPPGVESCRSAGQCSPLTVAREDAGQFRMLSFDGFTRNSDQCSFGQPIHPNEPPTVSATFTGSLGGVAQFSFYAAFFCSPHQMLNSLAALDIDMLSVASPGLEFTHITGLELASAVPEPEAYALLLVGLALLHRKTRRHASAERK